MAKKTVPKHGWDEVVFLRTNLLRGLAGFGSVDVDLKKRAIETNLLGIAPTDWLYTSTELLDLLRLQQSWTTGRPGTEESFIFFNEYQTRGAIRFHDWRWGTAMSVRLHEFFPV